MQQSILISIMHKRGFPHKLWMVQMKIFLYWFLPSVLFFHPQETRWNSRVDDFASLTTNSFLCVLLIFKYSAFYGLRYLSITSFNSRASIKNIPSLIHWNPCFPIIYHASKATQVSRELAKGKHKLFLLKKNLTSVFKSTNTFRIIIRIF